MNVEAFEQWRPLMMGLAYRMLGEVHEAEDAVQDAYLRWSQAEGIEAPAAWLTKVVTNLCINRLNSARVRRESYAGTWLPEPVSTADAAFGPMETAEQRETVSLALLSLMENLTPAERAVFVLREAFAYPHREIADIIDVTEAASRQLHSRARKHLGDASPRFDPDPTDLRKLVERFVAAASEGDVSGLEALLAEDVIAWSDGGGKVTAARRPILGRNRVARFVLGVVAQVEAMDLDFEEINGRPAIVGRLHGEPAIVAAFEASNGRIQGLWNVLNPDKLQRLSHPTSPSGHLWREKE
ncbi:RNA polymerase sigma-70 factor [Actinomadura barringtoniae]|uniref:RNA polymerase sigma-70 factor n=1 Tax=Actinomadura barringtoniae TaxID=1427535 RepID=A0A939PP67_9ACTN|nr:RNA polymerase sigma-70 factor [Actinomadura barringtoniae]MBO2452674.1 RNA polymerase sigma-70 factor [Actinomadura barringtoniae]